MGTQAGSYEQQSAQWRHEGRGKQDQQLCNFLFELSPYKHASLHLPIVAEMLIPLTTTWPLRLGMMIRERLVRGKKRERHSQAHGRSLWWHNHWQNYDSEIHNNGHIEPRVIVQKISYYPRLYMWWYWISLLDSSTWWAGTGCMPKMKNLYHLQLFFVVIYSASVVRPSQLSTIWGKLSAIPTCQVTDNAR